MSGIGEKFYIVDSVILRQVKPGVHVPVLDIVRVNSIAAFYCRILNALLHHGSNARAVRVDPFLIGPWAIRFTNGILWKGIRIRPPVLPRSCTEVADHRMSFSFVRLDSRF